LSAIVGNVEAVMGSFGSDGEGAAVALLVVRYVAGMSFEQFVANELVFDAVIRNLEIVGEAAWQVPDDLRGRYPDIPWPKLVGFRNVLAHAYADVDEVLVI
jgi:uncharacterized protein with HEPN domain